MTAIKIDAAKILDNSSPLNFFSAVQTRFNAVWTGGRVDWVYKFSLDQENTPLKTGASIEFYETQSTIDPVVRSIGSLNGGYTQYQFFEYTFVCRVKASNRNVLKMVESLLCKCIKDEYSSTSRIVFGKGIRFSATALPYSTNESRDNTSTIASLIKFNLSLSEDNCAWDNSQWTTIKTILLNGDIISGSTIAPEDSTALFGTVKELSDAVVDTYSSGKLGYVASLRDYFFLEKTTNTGSVDNISHIPASGGGVWHRIGLGSTYWSRQTEWNIDTSFGSDENLGSIDAPIKTLDELSRRVFEGKKLKDSYAINVKGTSDLISDSGLDITLVGGRTDFLTTEAVEFSGSSMSFRGRGTVSLDGFTFNRDISLVGDAGISINISNALLSAPSFNVEGSKLNISNSTITSDLTVRDYSTVSISSTTNVGNTFLSGTNISLKIDAYSPIYVNGVLVQQTEIPYADIVYAVNIDWMS